MTGQPQAAGQGRPHGAPSDVQVRDVARDALWTSGDICRHFRVAPKTLLMWRRRSDFPPAVLEPASGRGGVWFRDAVLDWHHYRNMRWRGKRGAAVAMWRSTRSVGQVARRLGVSRDTVARWLDELGERPIVRRGRRRRRRPEGWPR